MWKRMMVALLALGLAGAPAAVAADAPDQAGGIETRGPVTKLEKAIVRQDKLVSKDFYRMGDVAGSFTFQAAVISTPDDATQEKIYGIVIELTDMGVFEQVVNAMAGSGKTAKTGRSYIDFDEISFLIGALETVGRLSKQLGTREVEYSEVVYSTRNNDQFGFFQRGRGQTTVARIAGVGKELSLDDLRRVKEFLQTASARLKEMGAK